jgi:iron(II)-dependent oxidoreductase
VTDLRARLIQELEISRRRSDALTAVLAADDLLAQHSVLMSPLIWDVAHIANYEELWLARAAGGLAPYRPELDQIYDAFAHPRSDRAQLPILGPEQARTYAEDIRARALDALERADLDPAVPLTGAGFVHSMVFQHEHQHDETMLATHQLRSGEAVLAASAGLPAGPRDPDTGDVLVDGGPATIGTSTDPWSWDNERPAHAVDIAAFRIDVLPVSNAQFAEFVTAGGYDTQRWWTQEGWAHRTEARLVAPEFWTADGAGWFTRQRFGRVEALPPNEPVQHVTFHEATAYARWRGRRLPTEAEWEKACGWDPIAGQARKFPWGAADPTPELANLAFSDGSALRPAEVGAYPAGASAYGVQQLIGDVWEWTSSPFRSYPGFRSYPYDEYSQVFFGPEYRVLRGGSWATHPTVARTTFRNWDYPIRRQIFAGFRTAVSA